MPVNRLIRLWMIALRPLRGTFHKRKPPGELLDGKAERVSRALADGQQQIESELGRRVNELSTIVSGAGERIGEAQDDRALSLSTTFALNEDRLRCCSRKRRPPLCRPPSRQMLGLSRASLPCGRYPFGL